MLKIFSVAGYATLFLFSTLGLAILLHLASSAVYEHFLRRTA